MYYTDNTINNLNLAMQTDQKNKEKGLENKLKMTEKQIVKKYLNYCKLIINDKNEGFRGTSRKTRIETAAWPESEGYGLEF
ncbi:MAG: hypothetical protein N3B16_10155 [Candidatus Aminicenantes bacterium]|nr:hypothetical protein [Candidatus Aminicenantes bacterium]